MTLLGATCPEHRARAIARRWHHVTPRKLAKKAGVTIEIAKMIIDEEQRRRAA